MSDKDLECFDWGSDVDSEDDCEVCHEFVVTESQEEEENFKIHPGFKVSI